MRKGTNSCEWYKKRTFFLTWATKNDETVVFTCFFLYCKSEFIVFFITETSNWYYLSCFKYFQSAEASVHPFQRHIKEDEQFIILIRFDWKNLAGKKLLRKNLSSDSKLVILWKKNHFFSEKKNNILKHMHIFLNIFGAKKKNPTYSL